ncbi:MAG: response regulator [Lachnospiraceae bacterium]|nr:response regulator [Lachnospiraceae bacterium]MBR4174057.1 response regulator [Lachnospiraceae bacterium]
MIKVFLAEDEYVIRAGIRNNVDWEAHGYEFCGEAGDGELAFSLIRKLNPDIVVTDIRMPFMDGLELSRHIKEELPKTEIIILSGYEEFEYAKRSIELGVAQYLLKPISAEKLIEELDRIKEKILKKREEGDFLDKLNELSGAFEKVSRSYTDKNDRDDTEGAHVFKADLDVGNINLEVIKSEKLKAFLKTGETEDVEIFLEDFFAEISNEMRSVMFCQYMIMDIYFMVADFMEQLGGDRSCVEVFDFTARREPDSETASRYITRIVKSAVAFRVESSSDKYRDVVDSVIAYIDENYSREGLSLNDVASHVGLSPNHLSTVFSQKTGKTFIKYLTDRRISKAKELLRCTGKKSAEISVMVGYSDPHYFSSLFKKTTGITPKEYRQKKAGTGLPDMKSGA